MEESQSQAQPMPHQPEVSFPQPKEAGSSASNKKTIIAVIGVILIIVVGGWFVLGNSSGGSSSPSPSPTGALSAFPTPEVQTPTPSATPSPSPVAKDQLKVEVLNGTGVPGEAGFLQKELEEMGFENIDTGNADKQDATETMATYSRELNSATADELTAKLEELYEKVRTRRASISGGFDISITTGPRKTSKTASPKATATSTSSPTSSPTATPLSN